MSPGGSDLAGWRRRARPLLGTLVEVGLPAETPDGAFDAAFEAVKAVQQCLSRHDADSDLSHFHALAPGQALRMRPATQAVLSAAAELQQASGGLFDISLGTSPQGWRCEHDQLIKQDPATRLDAGGIAKGHAVDCAVHALMAQGCPSGWVNAGGDLRAFGDVELPVQLRIEDTGGVRPFATLRDGALATSHFGPGSRSTLAQGRRGRDRIDQRLHLAHLSVAAPLCLWADALTKVVAIRGDLADPLLARFQASAWAH